MQIKIVAPRQIAVFSGKIVNACSVLKRKVGAPTKPQRYHAAAFTKDRGNDLFDRAHGNDQPDSYDETPPDDDCFTRALDAGDKSSADRHQARS